MFPKKSILASPPKSRRTKSGQIIPAKPKIPALYTLKYVKSADRIMKIMLYLFAAFSFLKINRLSSLIMFNFGMKNAQDKSRMQNIKKSILFEMSALENPPVNIRVIEYALSGFRSIKKDIMELVNKFKESPIRISFVTENFENPLNDITRAALTNAPKKPKSE